MPAHSMAGSTVLRLTYGYTPKDEEDEYIAIAERAVDSFSLLTTPGMFMVDVFPFREATNLLHRGILF
jgi:hypothetical protein